MLGIDELSTLLDKIYNKITSEVTIANRGGEQELRKVLEKYGISYSNHTSYSYIDLASSKILIVGQVNIKDKDIKGICKTLSIDSNRLDYIDYVEATNYDFSNLKYSNKYSDIIFGATPHKGKGIANNNSIITMLESNSSEYPNVIRAVSSNELKITKTSFKDALKKTKIYCERND